MGNTLGGSLFTHNALKYDYCIEEAIMSLVHLCDEVVCLDAESDDGTYDLLKNMEQHNSKLRIIQSKWEQHVEGDPLYDRLCILANEARNALTADYHFMLQADEVVHEESHETIRNLVNNGHFNSARCFRLNLWGNHDRYVKTTSPFRPCGDYITRLAKQNIPVIGDAESLQSSSPHLSISQLPIYIFHYGLVRNPHLMVDKVIDMQKWFHDNHVDHRYLRYKQEGKPFDPCDGNFMDMSETTEIPIGHPAVAKQWVDERRHFYER